MQIRVNGYYRVFSRPWSDDWVGMWKANSLFRTEELRWACWVITARAKQIPVQCNKHATLTFANTLDVRESLFWTNSLSNVLNPQHTHSPKKFNDNRNSHLIEPWSIDMQWTRRIEGFSLCTSEVKLLKGLCWEKSRIIWMRFCRHHCFYRFHLLMFVRLHSASVEVAELFVFVAYSFLTHRSTGLQNKQCVSCSLYKKLEKWLRLATIAEQSL